MSSFTKKFFRDTLTYTVFFLLALTILIPHVQAEYNFIPLVGLPGLDKLEKTPKISEYLNAVYLLAIGLGALLGVMRIAWAGVKYSLSDIVTEKEDAKGTIKGVLLGLALLLIPFIVLKTINPNLTNLEVFLNAPKVKLDKNLREATQTQGNSGSTGNSSIAGNQTGTSDPQVGTSVQSCTAGISDPDKCKNQCDGLKGELSLSSGNVYKCTFIETKKPDYGAPPTPFDSSRSVGNTPTLIPAGMTETRCTAGISDPDKCSKQCKSLGGNLTNTSGNEYSCTYKATATQIETPDAPTPTPFDTP